MLVGYWFAIVMLTSGEKFADEVCFMIFGGILLIAICTVDVWTSFGAVFLIFVEATSTMHSILVIQIQVVGGRVSGQTGRP